VASVEGSLWDPGEVRAARRISRWTLAVAGCLAVAGLSLTAVGAAGAGRALLLLAILAFLLGSLAALEATSAGRRMF